VLLCGRRRHPVTAIASQIAGFFRPRLESSHNRVLVAKEKFLGTLSISENSDVVPMQKCPNRPWSH
jgi:hypothetical protein